MDWLWTLLLLALLLAGIWYSRKFARRTGRALYWPWWDSRRADREQQEYLVEREIARQDESPDEDSAP